MADPSIDPALLQELMQAGLVPDPNRPYSRLDVLKAGQPQITPELMQALMSRGAPQEMSSKLSPAADAFMGATGLPTSMGPAVGALSDLGQHGNPVAQVDRASDSVRDALIEPSIPNVANAGYQTMATALQPAKALGILGTGYGAALLKDLGAFDSSPAEAAGAKKTTAPKIQLPGLDESQQATYDAAVKKLSDQDYSSAAERRMLEDTIKEIRGVSSKSVEALNAAKATAVGKAAESKQGEYDRQVATAEALRDKELARDRRFSDTTVGQLYDKTGGYAPAVAAALTGAVSRGATGPGKSPGQGAFYNYGLPAGIGTLAGIGANNVPLLYNTLGTEPDNPRKRAFEEYARELPTEHPRKQEMTDYAAGLEDKNPVREAASKELYDWEKFKERAIMGGGEGVLGGLLGADAVRMPGRVTSFLGGLLRGPGGRPPTGGPGGGAFAGTQPLEGEISPTATAGGASSAGIPAVLPGGGGPPVPSLPPPGAARPNPELMKALLEKSPSASNANVPVIPDAIKTKDGRTVYQHPHSKRFVSPPDAE